MTLLMRTSERMTFVTCMQKWLWGWVENLRPREPALNLEFGNLVHQALAIYYQPGRKRGPLPAETFEQLAIATSILPDDGANSIELGVRMLEAYVPFWKAKDSEYSVISSEQTFQVPIGTVLGERIVYVGTLDGVWRHIPTKKIRFPEHKTATAISQDMLPMDEQVGSYWAFSLRWLLEQGILKEGESLDGILYNWLRKAARDPNTRTNAEGYNINKDGTVSKRQPSPFFARELTFRGPVEAKAVRHRVLQQARDMILARRDPERYVYKNPGPQFMPNCKFCPFKDPCELHETGHDYKTMLKAEYEVWEPYESHNLPERF